jgi:hypothetical protein
MRGSRHRIWSLNHVYSTRRWLASKTTAKGRTQRLSPSCTATTTLVDLTTEGRCIKVGDPTTHIWATTILAVQGGCTIHQVFIRAHILEVVTIHTLVVVFTKIITAVVTKGTPTLAAPTVANIDQTLITLIDIDTIRMDARGRIYLSKNSYPSSRKSRIWKASFNVTTKIIGGAAYRHKSITSRQINSTKNILRTKR